MSITKDKKEIVAKATAKHLRVSSYKANKVAQEIRGKSVDYAMALLQNMPQSAAAYFHKLLKSASANAKDLHSLESSSLIVNEALVNRARSFRRSKARARGRGTIILKPVSHLFISLSSIEGAQHGS